MDLDTYEQAEVAESQLGDASKYLLEEMELSALVVDGETIGYDVPNFVEMAITQTDPGYKGDTVSSGSTKPATLECGAVVQVPFHIKEGDVVKVDTRTDSYLERVSRK